MDIKKEIEALAAKIAKDEKLQAQFKADPIKAVESLLGIALPQDVVEKIVAGVKANLSAGQLSGVADALKKLF